MKRTGDWQEDIRRVANLIIGIDYDKAKKVICFMGIDKVELQKQICMILGKEIAARKKAVLVIHVEKSDAENVSTTMLDMQEEKADWSDIVLKGSEVDEVYAVPHDRMISELLGYGFEEKLREVMQLYDYIIINNDAIEQQAESIAIAAVCDETILLLEKGSINGNRAIHLKRELDMNKVHVLGSIFIK